MKFGSAFVKIDEKFNKLLEYPRVIWAKQKIMKQIQIGLCFFVEVVYNKIAVIVRGLCWLCTQDGHRQRI